MKIKACKQHLIQTLENLFQHSNAWPYENPDSEWLRRYQYELDGLEVQIKQMPHFMRHQASIRPLYKACKKTILEQKKYLKESHGFTCETPQNTHLEQLYLREIYHELDAKRDIFYFNDSTLENHCLNIENGRFFLGDSHHWYNTPEGLREINYVMSLEGRIYVHLAGKGILHHSSFFKDKPVACAGEIKVRNGKIISINNKSGHYLPSRAHLFQAVKNLAEKGVFMQDAQVEVYRENILSVQEVMEAV